MGGSEERDHCGEAEQHWMRCLFVVRIYVRRLPSPHPVSLSFWPTPARPQDLMIKHAMTVQPPSWAQKLLWKEHEAWTFEASVASHIFKMWNEPDYSIDTKFVVIVGKKRARHVRIRNLETLKLVTRDAIMLTNDEEYESRIFILKRELESLYGEAVKKHQRVFALPPEGKKRKQKTSMDALMRAVSDARRR